MKKALKILAVVALVSLLVCAGGLAWAWHQYTSLLDQVKQEAATSPRPPPRKVVVLPPEPEAAQSDPVDRATSDGLLQAEHDNDGPPGFGIVTAWDGRVIYTCDLKLDGRTRLGVGGWIKDGVPTFDPMVTVPMRMNDDDPVWVVAYERPGAVAWARVSDLGDVVATLPATGRRASCRVAEAPLEAQLGDPEAARKSIADMEASGEALREVLGVDEAQLAAEAP